MTPSSYPRRGDVYWTSLDPTQGAEMKKTRPCLVIGSNIVNQQRNTVVVIPLSTTSPKGPPLYIPLPSVGPKSQAVIDQIRAVDRSRLGTWECTITPHEMNEILKAMRVVFEIR